MTEGVNLFEGRSPYFYRFEDQRYSVADEYGDHAYTQHTIKCLVFPVIKYTKCGAWIDNYWEGYPRLPSPYEEGRDYIIGGRRFVNLQANKRYALPSIEEAEISYRARKAKQIRIYEARISGAKRHLEALDTFLYRHKVGHKQASPI